jgi:hypothetical protein
LDYVDHLSIRDRRDYIKRLVNRNLPDNSKFFVNSGIVRMRNESEEIPKKDKCRKFLKMQQDYLNKLRMKQLIQESHHIRKGNDFDSTTGVKKQYNIKISNINHDFEWREKT